MERRESLLKLFEELCCKAENDAVLDKCIELCEIYNTNVEKFLESWIMSCINDDKDLTLTLDILLEMEETILKKDFGLNGSPVEKMENQPKDIVNEQFVPTDAVETDDVVRMYASACCSNGESSKKRKNSDAGTSGTKLIRLAKSDNECSLIKNKAEDVVPIVVPSPSQCNMAHKNKILISLGKTIASWERMANCNVQVEQPNSSHVPHDMKYMYELMAKKGNILTGVCQNLGSKLCSLWLAKTEPAADIHYVKNVLKVSQTYFRTFGRINTKKGSANTVMLESCTRQKGASAADSILLDFRNVKQYSVFSGQIVALEATNPVGDTLYVREIFTQAYVPLAPTPRIQSKTNIFVAAGPFSASDNLLYQPLWDLMEQVEVNQPHVLILIGPFLDYAHLKIESLDNTYQEFFEEILIRLMKSVSQDTQVVLVTSNRDAQQEPVFPTPQYTVSNEKWLDSYPNLRLMPDPCILDVDGLRIGITSVDVIKHIGKEEISNISGMDRLARLADHLLSQTCFYPVYPWSEDLNVDTEMWEKYSFFDQQPHMLILPSDMRCYCKVINNCVTLNPERMHKRVYARLSIEPTLNGTWSPDNISCAITKI